MKINRIKLETILSLSTIAHVVGNEYRIRWDINTDSENESTSYTEMEWKGKPYDHEEVKDIINDWYNKECDNEILSSLHYEGNVIWLSSENQFNYKAAYDFTFQKQLLGLPFESPKFKLGPSNAPVYITFVDFEDLTTFIQKCFNHIQTTLDKYWEIKDNIDWSLYEL